MEVMQRCWQSMEDSVDTIIDALRGIGERVRQVEETNTQVHRREREDDPHDQRRRVNPYWDSPRGDGFTHSERSVNRVFGRDSPDFTTMHRTGTTWRTTRSATTAIAPSPRSSQQTQQPVRVISPRVSPTDRDGLYDSQGRRIVNPQAAKILRYEGIEKNGFIGGWIDSLENTAVTFQWGDTYRRLAITDNLGPKPQEHLLTFNTSEIRTYDQIKRALLERFGECRNKEMVRNAFPHLHQETNEDFFDRLLRNHRRGWSQAPASVKDQEVLNAFVYGLTNERLGEDLEAEYAKLTYVHNPPNLRRWRLGHISTDWKALET